MKEKGSGKFSDSQRKPIDGRPVRTIVADDSSFVRESLWRLIGQIPQIEVVGMANDGIEALELVSLSKPQLVLMDFQMPKMDGLEAACMIRDLDPLVKIIIMTAHDLQKVQASGMARCADVLLAKQDLPFELADAVMRLFPNDLPNP